MSETNNKAEGMANLVIYETTRGTAGHRSNSKTNATAHEGRTIEPARSTVGDADSGRSPGSRVVARGTAFPTYRCPLREKYMGGVRPAGSEDKVSASRG
jgi:hypothetical protein